MRRRRLREWIMIWALVGYPLASPPLPLVASPQTATLPPDRMDALLAPIALYPDPLLAKVLVAATYPLEVHEAEGWIQQHKLVTGAALDHMIAGQPWDDSVKGLVQVPAVLSTLDNWLEWTQLVGDAFLAQPDDTFASIQRLRKLALKARTLHSASQQSVTSERDYVVIEPVIAQLVNIPFYDPQVAYGEWPHPNYPPMWWTPPPGYTYGSGLGFMRGVGIPVAFWKDRLDWDSGKVLIDEAVSLGDYNRVTGTPWAHNPEHRRFVSYSVPELRIRYGRDFMSGKETHWSFRGYDTTQEPLSAERAAGRRRTAQIREASNDAKPTPRLSTFEDVDHGWRERLYSKRGNASIMAARRDNSHFAMSVNEIEAALQTDSVAAR